MRLFLLFVVCFGGYLGILLPRWGWYNMGCLLWVGEVGVWVWVWVLGVLIGWCVWLMVWVCWLVCFFGLGFWVLVGVLVGVLDALAYGSVGLCFRLFVVDFVVGLGWVGWWVVVFWLVLFVLLVWFCGLGLVCFRVGFLVIVEFVFVVCLGLGWCACFGVCFGVWFVLYRFCGVVVVGVFWVYMGCCVFLG